MRTHLQVATWILAALCGACGSRALPKDAGGSVVGGPVEGKGGQGHPGGAGRGGEGGVTGSGEGGIAGTTGSAGAGGADATTGGAGVGGGAGGAAGTGGATPPWPDCPPGIAHGQACVVGSICTNIVCAACSDRYWRLERPLPCVCATGVWDCPSPHPGMPGGDCIFDPPLDCPLAQILYEDATCQTHPPCSAGDEN